MAKPSVIADEFRAIQTALEVLEPLGETQRKFAMTMILTRLGMNSSSLTLNSGAGGAGEGVATGPAGAGGGKTGIKTMTPKEFLRLKRPTTDLERMICLAFYLANARDTSAFK